MKNKVYYTYILSNKRRTVYYVGFTDGIDRRWRQHEIKYFKNAFTSRYNVDELLYFEEYNTIKEALAREKQLKGWARERKIELIKTVNPNLDNIFNQF